MTQATQAISLLLLGTTMCVGAYEASLKRYTQEYESFDPSQMDPTTQPGGNGNNSNSYYHSHYYGHPYSHGFWSGGGHSSSSPGFSHGSVERGGFGSHGHSGS